MGTSEERLHRLVKEVSEDKKNLSIEFNEFLRMMSLLGEEHLNIETLMEAFNLFDTDDDGMISKQELQKILTKCKGKSSQKEVLETLEDFDGCLDYKEFCSDVCQENEAVK